MSAIAPAPLKTSASAELVVDALNVRYGSRHAVRDVSLRAAPGRTLALVGESGCGKSSLALAIARLLPVGTEVSGQVRVGDVELSAARGPQLRDARGRVVAYVPQDAMAALNPVYPAGRQIAEVLRLRRGLSRTAARTGAIELLEEVGITDPQAAARRYPHELSGGMRQRVMLAIALAGQPLAMIADEPTTALDVTVQAGIVARVSKLVASEQMILLWITHDIGVVAEIADDVAVMYGGKIVERGPVMELFERPAHPYTRALIGSAQGGRTAAPKSSFEAIPGAPPVGAIPAGCAFHPRCPLALPKCAASEPEHVKIATDHLCSCHLVERA